MTEQRMTLIRRRVLKHLLSAEEPQATVAGIANDLGEWRPSVSRALTDFVERGWVTMQGGKRDRQIRLTDEGVKVATRIHDRRERLQNDTSYVLPVGSSITLDIGQTMVEIAHNAARGELEVSAWDRLRPRDITHETFTVRDQDWIEAR